LSLRSKVAVTFATGDASSFRHLEVDKLREKAKAESPAGSLVTIEDVGAATAFLAHDVARLIHVDGGYHVVD
jgi:enoyl-[acyl-carrier-protein] reductase (NADH)